MCCYKHPEHADWRQAASLPGMTGLRCQGEYFARLCNLCIQLHARSLGRLHERHRYYQRESQMMDFSFSSFVPQVVREWSGDCCSSSATRIHEITCDMLGKMSSSLPESVRLRRTLEHPQIAMQRRVTRSYPTRMSCRTYKHAAVVIGTNCGEFRRDQRLL
jgi:hypothetical protein